MAMMFSVAEFCHEHGISRGLFYTLAKEGRGPKTVKLGRRTLVSHEAAEEWRRRMESPTRGGPDDGSEITQRPTIERGKAQSGVVGETLFSPHGGERKGPSGDCTWLWAGRARAGRLQAVVGRQKASIHYG